MAEIEKEFRGIPLYAAEATIMALPDVTKERDTFQGPGWTIFLKPLPEVKLGSLTFGRLSFVLQGEREIIDRVWKKLAPGFLRGGG